MVEAACNVPRRNGPPGCGRMPLWEMLASTPFPRPAPVSPSTPLQFPATQKTGRGNNPLQTPDGARKLLSSCALTAMSISCLHVNSMTVKCWHYRKRTKRIHCTGVYQSNLAAPHYIPIDESNITVLKQATELTVQLFTPNVRRVTL